MKIRTLLRNALQTACAIVGALVFASPAQAALRIPYVPDADTLHLWHLDDTNGLYTIDALTYSASGSTNAIPITLTNLGEPTPGTGPYTNTSLGNPSYAGMGTCYTSTTKQHLLFGGSFPDVTQFCNPSSGAFTFEALVNLNGSFSTADMEILTGDNGDAITGRGWQWRIDNGVIEWDLLGGSTDNDFKATLPTSGPDAIATNVWYHIAVTYTGNTPTNSDPTNVITFYWTLLDPSRTNADMLQQFTATRPLNGSPEGATTPSLGIGGSARNTTSNPGNNEGLIGSIDEVRVSDIARSSNQMAFGAAQAVLGVPYNPDADTLHLWHLDETNNLFSVDALANSASGSTNAIPITLTNLGEPTPGTFPYTNTSLGNLSFAGLGTCYTSITKQHLLYGGSFPDVTQFCNPSSGAFTFEALVNLNASFSTADMEILTGDNGDAITGRGWQWRIDNGVIEWDLLGGSTDNDFKATLPTSGPDAIATNVWYHIAVTYTGNTPTNSDPTNLITFYWTLLDPTRTNADMLQQFTATRPLNGSPEGATTPSLGIGGSARNTTSNPGNNEGLIGSIDEVRVSDIARASNHMAFLPSGASKPSITQEPPALTLAPYGGNLVINAVVSASQASYTWSLNGANVPNQSGSTLQISNVTFANGGSYVLVVSNSLGSVTTTVAQVTVGAEASDLFSTGVNDKSQVLADVPDPHYELIQSQDASFLGPAAMVFEWNNPIEFAINNGGYAPTNGSSIWIGDQGNSGGVYNGSSPGTYTYRTAFLLDQANPSSITLSAKFFCNGTATLVLNGQNTGITINPGGALYTSAFTMSNFNNQLFASTSGSTFVSQSFTNTSSTPWFVPGLNTLDFVETITGGGSAILVEDPVALGQALPPGLPTIVLQPVSQTVRDASLTGPGSVALFSVVAVGRPPLTYQWWVNDAPVTGATNRLFQILNPTNGLVGTNFFCQVFNASGSVASEAVSLTIVPTNQPPVAPVFYSVVFDGMETNNLSQLLVLVDHDPDGDALTLAFADSSSTNNGTVNNTGADIIYTAPPGYVGPDQYTYTIQDALGAMSVGVVKLQNFLAPSPLSDTVTVGTPVSFSAGVTNPPAGYTFQWTLNGANIAGATNGFLNIASASLANAGTYVLVVTDPNGVAWPSPPAALIVQGAPTPPGFSSAALSSGVLTLNWTNGTTLQVSGSVLGPWTNVTGASSPFTVTNLTLPQQFYRIEP